MPCGRFEGACAPFAPPLGPALIILNTMKEASKWQKQKMRARVTWLNPLPNMKGYETHRPHPCSKPTTKNQVAAFEILIKYFW